MQSPFRRQRARRNRTVVFLCGAGKASGWAGAAVPETAAQAAEVLEAAARAVQDWAVLVRVAAAQEAEVSEAAARAVQDWAVLVRVATAQEAEVSVA